MEISYQCAVILTLTSLLVVFEVQSRRRSKSEWQAIVDRFVSGDSEIASLSYFIGFSEDLACDPAETASKLRGIRPLWVLYLNIRVLLKAIEYVAAHMGCEEGVKTKLECVRSQIRLTKRLILLTICSRLFHVSSDTANRAEKVARAYFRSFALLGLVLNDYLPHLMVPFLCEASRT